MQLCKSMNGGLLEVDDVFEHELVSAELHNLHPEQSGFNVTYWTGLIDLRDEGSFVWTDSQTSPVLSVRAQDLGNHDVVLKCNFVLHLYNVTLVECVAITNQKS